MSREERKKAFLRKAEAMYEELEGWYDAHPEATFGEIEAEARQQRRELMGEALEVLVNGRDVGKVKEAPACQACGGADEVQGIPAQKGGGAGRRQHAGARLLRLS
jgi:ribosomal protein S6E (S10)